MKILIIDSVMGSGKSNWAINNILNSRRPIMYVTPYLEEVARFKSAIPNIYEPFGQSEGMENKTAGLMKLLEKGLNIATTHSLFSIITDEMIEVIRNKGYSLILDEVVDAYQTYPMTRQDYNLLKENEYIYIDEETSKIYPNTDEDSKYIKNEMFAKGVFYEFFHCVENSMMYEHNNTPIIEYPVKLFKAFYHVTVLTYMFHGATLKALFEINDMEYQIKTLPNIKKYKSEEFVSAMLEYGYLFEGVNYNGNQFNSLIDIETTEKLNFAKNNTDLSVTWYKKHGKYMCDSIGKKTRSFLSTKCKAKSEECLYTTLKEFYDLTRVKGYASSFVVMNVRATNKYADRKYGAYLINRFLNPIVKKFIIKKGSNIDEDMFALSEMLQWIWRLRIRNGESIKIFVPSDRMRNLLINWLNNKEE